MSRRQDGRSNVDKRGKINPAAAEIRACRAVEARSIDRVPGRAARQAQSVQSHELIRRRTIGRESRANASRSSAAFLVTHAREAPGDHRRFQPAAGVLIVPLAVGVEALEWKLIGAAVIFAEHLDRLTRRRLTAAVELRQPLFARSHSVHLPKTGHQG
jgi:hypothetical protein